MSETDEHLLKTTLSKAIEIFFEREMGIDEEKASYATDSIKAIKSGEVSDPNKIRKSDRFTTERMIRLNPKY